MDIYLVIGVADGTTKSVVHLKNVSVKVTSVTNELVVFVNQKDFYAYYTDERFVSVLKGKELKIPKERIFNHE